MLLYTCNLCQIDSKSFLKSFLLAYRRFILRCCTPENFISDNLKTFKAVEAQIFMRYLQIKWNFILESPHGGGCFYERMVPTSNNTLKKVDGSLDYEQLNNVLIEIENIINSWLLTNVNNKNVNESLTLYNLIHGRNIAKNKVLQLEMANHYV